MNDRFLFIPASHIDVWQNIKNMNRAVLIISASLYAIESDRYVNLAEMRLFEFPNNIMQSVERLNMVLNFIERISATDLSTFRNLTHLYLDNNRIKYLENGCFDSNIRLTNLELSFNMIVYFRVSLGPLITMLRVLTLSASLTKILQILTSDHFTGCTGLVYGRITLRRWELILCRYCRQLRTRLILMHVPCTNFLILICIHQPSKTS